MSRRSPRPSRSGRTGAPRTAADRQRAHEERQARREGRAPNLDAPPPAPPVAPAPVPEPAPVVDPLPSPERTPRAERPPRAPKPPRTGGRSRLVPFVLLILVLTGGGVVGSQLAGSKDDTPKSAALPQPDAADAIGDQQQLNGPISAPSAAGLLNLKLAGTTDRFSIDFQDPPRGGLVFDLDSGEVLWRRNPTTRLKIASVTKIMTALVVVNRLKPGAKALITKQARYAPGSAVGLLPVGKRVGVSALLYGLLLPSGNDAAIALAQRTSGSVGEFVEDMNARVQAMGLKCTHYSSPSGFTDARNYSCPADLAVEARALLDQPRLAKIVKRRSAVLPFPIKGGKLYLYNHNYFLKEGYPGTLGIKTGFTDLAGKCFVVAVKHGRHRYGVVLLNSPDPSKQARQLLARAYQVNASA